MQPAATSGPTWHSALAPYVEREQRVELKVPITLPAGRMIHDVAGVFMRFPKWTGAPFVDDFGRKSAAMIELDGEHLFPELAVLRVLEKDGWNGRWVSTYSAGKEVWKYLTEWKDVPREEQRTRPLEDADPRQLIARIAGFNKPRRYKGMLGCVRVARCGVRILPMQTRCAEGHGGDQRGSAGMAAFSAVRRQPPGLGTFILFRALGLSMTRHR